MKKKSIFSVLLVMLVLGVTLFAATTLADTEPKATLKVWTEKTDQVNLDEEVDFYFTLDGFTELGVANFTVAPSDGLELVDSEILNKLGTTKEDDIFFNEWNEFMAVNTDITGIDQPIDVLRVTFKAVGGGEQTVEAVYPEFFDADMNLLDVEGTAATISVYVPCEHQWAADEDGHIEATCTEPGKQSYTCGLCGATKTEVVEDEEALGHDYEAVVEPAGCETEEKTTFTCKRCGDTYTETTGSALGHDFVADEDGHTDATCTEPGKQSYTCARCGATKTEVVEDEPAIGHDYKVVVQNAGCETTGLKTFTCANCGDEYTEEIPALGHDFDEGIVTTEPGCETEGVLTCTCQREGCEGTKTEVIKALGHEDKDGDKLCDRCGADMSEPEPTPVDPQEEPKADTPGTGIAGESSVAAVVALLGAALCIGGVLILKKRSAR